MLNTLDELKLILKNDTIPIVPDNVHKELVIYFPSINLTIQNDRIVEDSFSMEETLFSDSDIVFGSCESTQLKITVADVQEDLEGLECIVNQFIDGFEEAIPLGTYKVKSCKKQNDKRFKDITAYDNMKKFDIDVSAWYNSLTFPITLKNFRASLCNYVGVEEEIINLPNDNILVEKTIEPTKLSGRVVLSACEEINGCFGHMSRQNKLKHIVITNQFGLYPTETLYPANDLYPEYGTEIAWKAMYRSVEFEDYIVKAIDKLQIRQEEDDIGAIVGTGTNAYVIEGNFLVFGKGAAELEQIALNAFENIKNRPYQPFKSVNIGLPYMELGDPIAFDAGDVVVSYIFKRTLSGIQALKDEYSADGSEEREQNFGLNREIIQLKGKAAILKKTIEEVSATVVDVENELSGQISVLAGQVVLKVDASGNVAAVSLDADPSSGTSIKLKADNISLEGIVTANSRFKILADGSMEAVNGKFTGDIIGSNITGGIFTSVGPQSTTSIAGGEILSEWASIRILNVPTQLQAGFYISLVASTGTINTLNINTQAINGYTPVTSNNISGFPVNYAITAGYANTAGDASSLLGQVYVSSNSNFRPYIDAQIACGTSAGRWTSVWAVNGSIVTSDERKKNSISYLDERYLKFIKAVQPRLYKMNDGQSGRIHTGMIAQEIENIMNDCHISDMEFAGLIKAPVYSEKDEFGEYNTDSDIIDKDYALRYDEFIALLILWLRDIEERMTNGN